MKVLLACKTIVKHYQFEAYPSCFSGTAAAENGGVFIGVNIDGSVQ